MLRFLRKYQKWMLVVFCAVLMVAFLIPQAQEQFAPRPSKRTVATTYDGEKITQEILARTDNDIKMMRRLRLDPILWPGLTLIPNTGNETKDAYVWLLIQRAAERNNLGASDQEAFNLIASVLDVQDEEGLKGKAGEIGQSAGYLLELGRQYLVAEQYRQLVAGIEFVKPTGANSQVASPGLQRYAAAVEANSQLRQQLNDPLVRFEAMQRGISEQQLMFNVISRLMLSEVGDRIVGHERVTSDQLRYLLQRQLTQMDLSVVLLDAEDRRAAVTVTQDDIDKLFERYADDAPGLGQPYGLGYRVPDRVKLEAIRIPIDAVRRAVAKEITPDDIFKFYDDNRSSFIDISATPEGEAPRPQTLTAVQREEIRLTLTQNRAEEKAFEIAKQVRLRLNEDSRGLDDDGIYKKLPKDFQPTPLVEVAAEIEQEHGITPEIIQVDNWIGSDEIADSGRFTSSWINRLPSSTIQVPTGFGLEKLPVSESVLGGRGGLFASFAQLENGQIAGLSNLIRFARAFIEMESDENDLAIQAGLPGLVLQDMTRSTYVFRLTEASPSHPRTNPAPIADQLREDASKVAAYEQLVEEKETLIERAAAQSIEVVMVDKRDKQTLTGVTREDRAMPIVNEDGEIAVQSNGAIIVEAFGVADEIAAATGLENADEKDRIFIVELPSDYKIALVRLDSIRPLTRSAFEQQADNRGMLVLASRIASAESEAPDPLSIEALMQATGFQWAEGYSMDNLEDSEDEEEAEDADDEDEDADDEEEEDE